MTALSHVLLHLHSVEGCFLNFPWHETAGLQSIHENHRGTGPKRSLEEITPAWPRVGSVEIFQVLGVLSWHIWVR